MKKQFIIKHRYLHLTFLNLIIHIPLNIISDSLWNNMSRMRYFVLLLTV